MDPIAPSDRGSLTSSTAAPLTQLAIGAHLDLSERSVRDLLSELGIDHKTTSIDDIRIAYIRKLREGAAGRATAGDLDLAQERAALARSQREGIDIKNAVARGSYAPIFALTETLATASQAVAERFDHLPSILAKSCPDLTSTQRDVILSVISAALAEWISSTVAIVSRSLSADDDADPAPAEPGDAAPAA